MSDIDFVARRAAFEKATEPINADLQKAGVEPSRVSAYDEIFAGKEAIDVFLRHVDGPYPANVKALMMRAMASPLSEPFFDILAQKLRTEIESTTDGLTLYRDALAWALAQSVASTQTLKKLYELITDTSLGEVRVLFLARFKKVKDPVIVDLLDDLADDPQLRKEICSWKSYWKKNRPAVLERCKLS